MDIFLFMRLTAQLMLVAWCAVEAAVLLLSRGRMTRTVGVEYAVAGLALFGAWMFLLSVTIARIEAIHIIPGWENATRGDLVPAFAILEVATAVLAWCWLIVNIRYNFSLPVHRKRRGSGLTGTGAT